MDGADIARTLSSDIWAWGCLFIEVRYGAHDWDMYGHIYGLSLDLVRLGPI